MKISKAIREYISDEVGTRLLAASEVSKLEEEYSRLCEEAKAELKRMDDEFNEKLKDFNERYGLIGNRAIYSNFSWRPPYNPLNIEDKLHDAKNELSIRKEREVNRILATLELGGTKDDLDRLLSEIK